MLPRTAANIASKSREAGLANLLWNIRQSFGKAPVIRPAYARIDVAGEGPTADIVVGNVADQRNHGWQRRAATGNNTGGSGRRRPAVRLQLPPGTLGARVP